MTSLHFVQSDFDALVETLTTGDVERCAVALTQSADGANTSSRLVVGEIVYATEADYRRQGALEAELSPTFVAGLTKRARSERCGLVFVHSHPGDHAPHFSQVDDWGESRLAAFLAHRHPQARNLAMVVSKGGVRARVLGSSNEVSVVSVGLTRTVRFSPDAFQEPPPLFDRQVRAFGRDGQRALQALSVGIVGLGGTGSIVAEQLAHLGVRRFVLIDPDVVEPTNLNRLVGAHPSDVGAPKVKVIARLIGSINPDAHVVAQTDDVIRQSGAGHLLSCDLFFGCTDSHGSRAVLQQVAYQYLIPYIDVGTTIAVREGKLTHIIGRAQLLAPGLACFACDGLLDPSQVRRDLMSAFERQADPYFQGAHEPAPAVISINGTASSLAVTMLLAVVAGAPSPARHLLYNAMLSSLRSVRASQNPSCYICSREGALARGDSWPLNTRRDG